MTPASGLDRFDLRCAAAPAPHTPPGSSPILGPARVFGRQGSHLPPSTCFRKPRQPRRDDRGHDRTEQACPATSCRQPSASPPPGNLRSSAGRPKGSTSRRCAASPSRCAMRSRSSAMARLSAGLGMSGRGLPRLDGLCSGRFHW